MAIAFLRRFFGAKNVGSGYTASVSKPAPVSHKLQIASPDGSISQGVPIYPPIDPGLLIVEIDGILAGQKQLIQTLERNIAIAPQEFQRKYLGPLTRAAELVNLLPASRDKHHAGAGGLFRLSCAMAVRAAQSAEGKIFAANEAIERRRPTEQAWRHASFLTGLCSELCRPLTEMIVVDAKGNEWSPYLCSLTEFANKSGTNRVYIRWLQRDDNRSAAKAMTSWAVNVVVGNDLLSELHQIKPLIVETIYGVVSGAITSADNSTMAALINDVRRRVIEQDNDLAPLTYGKLTQGAHLEPYFMDAMRALLKNGRWKVNERGARCHFGVDGFYIAWRQGAEEILTQLREQHIDGIPTSRQTLEDMMGRAGIIVPAQDGSWIHMVSAFGVQPFPAIRIQSPGSVIGDLSISQGKSVLKVSATPAVAKPATPSKAVTPEKDARVAKPAQPREQRQEEPQAQEESLSSVQELPLFEPQQPQNESDHPEESKLLPVPPAQPSPPAMPDSSSAAPAPVNTTEHSDKRGKPEKPSPVNSDQPKRPPQTGRPKPAQEKEEEPQREPLNADLILELGASACREIAVMRDLWNRGEKSEHFLRVPEGLAITHRFLADEGLAMPWTNLQKVLQEKGHLHTVTISGRTRVNRMLPFPKQEELGAVFVTAFLRKAGFTLD